MKRIEHILSVLAMLASCGSLIFTAMAYERSEANSRGINTISNAVVTVAHASRMHTDRLSALEAQ